MHFVVPPIESLEVFQLNKCKIKTLFWKTQRAARGTSPYNQPVSVTTSLLTTIFFRIDLNVKISEPIYLEDPVRSDHLFIRKRILCSYGGRIAWFHCKY